MITIVSPVSIYIFFRSAPLIPKGDRAMLALDESRQPASHTQALRAALTRGRRERDSPDGVFDRIQDYISQSPRPSRMSASLRMLINVARQDHKESLS